MKKKSIYIFFFLLLAFSNISFSQFYFLEDVNDQIEIEFLRKKIVIKPEESFFNLLKINNPSNRAITFMLNFSYPTNWTFIGKKNQQITLSPNDSIVIPYRAAAAINTKGEIGYAFVASLSDLKGNTFKNEYSFVNIPKIKDIYYRPKSRIVYFDKYKKEANIDLNIANNGNTDEIFYFEFSFPNGITTKGADKGFYRKEVSLKPYTDSLIQIPVILDQLKSSNKTFHRIKLKTFTIDTIFNTSIWGKELTSSYYNEIPKNYTMLGIDLVLQNLFSEHNPTLSTNLYGNILFRKKGAISYNIQTYGKINAENLKYRARYDIKYFTKSLEFRFGDLPIIFGHNLYGRGGQFKLKKPKHEIDILGTKLVNRNLSHAAGSYKYKGTKSKSILIGASYEDDRDKKYTSSIIQSIATYGFKKIGVFKIGGAYSIANWYLNSNSNRTGFYGHFNYTKKTKNTRFNVSSEYGNRSYSGYYNGRLNLTTSLYHALKNEQSINIFYSYYNFAPAVYQNDILVSGGENSKGEFNSTYAKRLNKSMYLRLGLSSEDYYSNTLTGNFNTQNELETRNALGHLAYTYNNKSSRLFFSSILKGGYNFVTDYSIDETMYDHKNMIWPSIRFTTNIRSKHVGLSFNYYHGPYTINQQFSYFASNYYSKTLRLMPYLSMYIIPNFLKLDFNPAINYNVTSKSTRMNIVTSLVAYPGKTWQLELLNNYNYSVNKDAFSDEKYAYNSSYFQIRLTKDINFNQPKYQYHNLKVYFFKDFNGNRVKDADEPGLKDILFTIRQDDVIENTEQDNGSGYFMSIDLLSDLDGLTEYRNIPNGAYILEYVPIGSIEGAFSSEASMQTIYINKSETLYIPFFENNKIFGKVLLNRSKLSNLGHIDPSNIKVTAEDTFGKKYSSLTNANGEYIIFIPSVDKYKIKINNIFFENFELEQNDFEVQLNGYRQFEVNFVFNEKKRKINFASSYEYGSTSDAPGIEIVRRTNLSGKVKDATTLKPIVATIRVINKAGEEIISSKSNLKTGIFTTSFVAGNDYIIEVMAEDYWFHAESLYSNQLVTFKNLKKDIILKAITVGAIIPMQTLKFEAGSYDIPASSFPELERLLKVLKKNPSVKIAVHGHADDMEIQGSTIDLALERAKLVAKYLIANGYNRVKYVGHANTKPVADNDTEDGRKLNRRVEIVVTGK